VTGLRARGGVEVAIAWRDGKLVSATLTASASKPVKVRYAGREIELRAQAGRGYTLGPDLRVR